MAEDEEQRPDSLLPYGEWHEEALRQVVVRAMAHVAANGLPGEHHFYLTFRTDHPGTIIPARLRAQYPQVMTIVLQHQFWELKMDEAAQVLTVGLSFGGVPATLLIPIAAVTAFADPHARYGLQFRVIEPAAEAAGLPEPTADAAPPEAEPPAAEATPQPAEKPQIVSLDAFRRRGAPKT